MKKEKETNAGGRRARLDLTNPTECGILVKWVGKGVGVRQITMWEETPLVIYTDGGKDRIAYVIPSLGVETILPHTGMERVLGHKLPATNNESEYLAVLSALDKAWCLIAKEVEIRTDSQLIVNQLNNKFAVNEPRLYLLHALIRIQQYWGQLKVQFTWLPRKENLAGILLEK